ncbi:hypothetical protein ACOJIV_02760 [Haloarcula sp. AONF1]
MPEFSGYLVFNQIDRLRGEVDLDALSSQIPFESKGENSPKEPRRSIREVMLPARTVDEPVPREFLRVLDEEVRWFKYTLEEFRAEEGIDEDGEISTFYVREQIECDIFITSDGYVFFKGSQSDLQHVVELFYERLREVGAADNSRQLEFSSDFLLWLLYMYNSGDSPPAEVEVDQLTDARVVGPPNESGGRSNRVSGSTDVGRSAPILTGILAGKQISMLGGVFTVGGLSLNADIEESGRVHIKSEYDMVQLESEGRVVSSVTFLRELCNLWEQWRDLPPSEQFPPDEFFEQMYHDLNAAGVEVQFSLEPIIEEYRQKRGE